MSDRGEVGDTVRLNIDGVGFSYTGTPVLKDVTLDLEGSRFVSIIGPNGVGKSTLIHCMNKILTPTSGTVFLDGKDIKGFQLREMAKEMGYVPYTASDSFPLSVADTVLMGRHPYAKWGSREEDIRAVYEVLHLLDIEDFALRGIDELSAGQRQKVMLARGLVQNPRILLLDEPTANLDIKHQVEVTKILRGLTREKGIMVIMISHDLNIAAKYADDMILLHDGGIYAMGEPSDVITEKAMREVYGIDAKVISDEGRPHIIVRDASVDDPVSKG